MPVVFQWNEIPFEWISSFYTAVATSILFRFGFDRRYFRFVKKYGFPPFIAASSLAFSTLITSVVSMDLVYLPLAALVSLSLSLAIWLRSQANFVLSNFYDIPGMCLVLTLLSMAGQKALPWLLSILCMNAGAQVFRLTLHKSSTKPSSFRKCVSLRASINSSAGALAQSIITIALAALPMQSLAYDIRISERLAFAVTFFNSAALVITQYVATVSGGLSFLKSVGKMNLLAGGLIFLFILGIDHYVYDLVKTCYFIIFGIMYLFTMFLPPIGLAGDQLGFSNEILFSNIIFILIILAFAYFMMPLAAIAIYIILIGAERAIVSYHIKFVRWSQIGRMSP